MCMSQQVATKVALTNRLKYVSVAALGAASAATFQAIEAF